MCLGLAPFGQHQSFLIDPYSSRSLRDLDLLSATIQD